MTVPLTHREVSEGRLVERYVAGSLGGLERDRFEDHLLACDVCQADIRAGAAIRAELATDAAAVPRAKARRRWLVPVALAAAAIVAIAVFVPRRGDSRLTALGRIIEPPIYLGVELRGAPQRADSLFDAAMTAYAAHDYAAAASGLEQALSAGVDSAPSLFFLGASRLVTDQPDAAAAAFRGVIALGESPYLPEAHYYLAKSLLREGKADVALRELRMVQSSDSTVVAGAVALADSITRLVKR